MAKLINKLAKIRHEGADGSEKHERPRIMVTGANTQTLMCQICMGKIKEGTEFCTCGTGKVFHTSCLERLGSCPYCKRTYAIKGLESTTSRQVIEPIAGAPKSEPSPSVEEEGRCPVCEGAVAKDAGYCSSCGAIFITKSGTFNCPACGTQLDENERICPSCGEPFQSYAPYPCPWCGNPVGPNDKKCSCGAVLTDVCPECGFHLSEEDTVCKHCGSIFEFL